MTQLSETATSLLAGFGAALLSLTVMVGTFVTAEATVFAGVLA